MTPTRRISLITSVLGAIALTAGCSVTTGNDSGAQTTAPPATSDDQVIAVTVPASESSTSADSPAPSTESTTPVDSTTPVVSTTPVEPSPTSTAPTEPAQPTTPSTTEAASETSDFAAITAVLPVDDNDRWSAWSTQRCGIRAVVLNGPEQWGAIDNADGSATPEFALWHHSDGEWVRTDHAWLGASTTPDTAAAAYAGTELLAIDGLDEVALVTSMSTIDGPSATLRILDNNCNWWTRPVITPCGVVATPQAITPFPNSVSIMMSDAIDSPEWPCSVGDPWPIVWNNEFRMPEVDASQGFCESYNPAPVDDPMQALAMTITACTTGDVITAAQSMLVDRGVSIDVDGEFGPGTVRTLMRFQRDNGLEVTGRLDPATWSLLRPQGE